MTLSTLKSGQDKFEQELRTGANFACKQALHAWELEGSEDYVDLAIRLNAEAALAKRELERIFGID
jgi:hypothetical protein